MLILLGVIAALLLALVVLTFGVLQTLRTIKAGNDTRYREVLEELEKAESELAFLHQISREDWNR